MRNSPSDLHAFHDVTVPRPFKDIRAHLGLRTLPRTLADWTAFTSWGWSEGLGIEVVPEKKPGGSGLLETSFLWALLGPQGSSLHALRFRISSSTSQIGSRRTFSSHKAWA
jgi:hypothetical protein